MGEVLLFLLLLLAIMALFSALHGFDRGEWKPALILNVLLIGFGSWIALSRVYATPSKVEYVEIEDVDIGAGVIQQSYIHDGEHYWIRDRDTPHQYFPPDRYHVKISEFRNWSLGIYWTFSMNDVSYEEKQ